MSPSSLIFFYLYLSKAFSESDTTFLSYVNYIYVSKKMQSLFKFSNLYILPVFALFWNMMATWTAPYCGSPD